MPYVTAHAYGEKMSSVRGYDAGQEGQQVREGRLIRSERLAVIVEQTLQQ